MERLTVKRPDGRWAIANDDGANSTEQMLKIPEIIDRLAAYEDTGLEPEQIYQLQGEVFGLRVDKAELEQYRALGPIDHLKELVQAEQDGRVRILSKSEDKTCGSCGHFKRIPGKRSGTCEVRPYYTDHRGDIDSRRGTFTPVQSRKCCKQYLPCEEVEAALEGGGHT